MTIRRMRIACWWTKATDTHIEYVILIAFPGNNNYTSAPYVTLYTLPLLFIKQCSSRLLKFLSTGWTQKHSLISSSYKIKTYWNIFINMRLQIHQLKKFLIFPPAARGQWNARWRSLHSNAAGACWNFIKQTVLWMCSVLSNSNLMWIRLLTSPFWSGTGISLKEDASVIVDELQERITAAVKSVTPDMLQRVSSVLHYRIGVCRVTRGGGTLSVCDTTWNCITLCNCSHQFCNNIPVSFDFISTWNQGVFLCSPCIIKTIRRLAIFYTTICPYLCHISFFFVSVTNFGNKF